MLSGRVVGRLRPGGPTLFEIPADLVHRVRRPALDRVPNPASGIVLPKTLPIFGGVERPALVECAGTGSDGRFAELSVPRSTIFRR